MRSATLGFLGALVAAAMTSVGCEGDHEPSSTGPPAEVVWTASTTGIDEFLSDIWFVDESQGWTVGDRIWRTSDGGRTWNAQTSPFGLSLTSVVFLDARNGFAAGGAYYRDETSQGVIMRTTDGGETWSLSLYTDYGFNALSFVDEQYGWAVGESYAAAVHGVGRTYVSRTTDGGLTWEQRDVSEFGGGLKGVTFVDRQRGWVVGQRGTILATADGGRTWAAQSSGADSWLYDVAFVDGALGWVGGDREVNQSTSSAVLTTGDGGHSWAPQRIGTDLRSIQFLNPMVGWAAGPGGVFRTVDGGSAWYASDTGVSVWINSIHFLDETHGWASGDHGVVLSCCDSKAQR